MAEVILLPEMEVAGVEALMESRDRGLDDAATVIAIYLAMRCVEEMFCMRQATGSVH